MKQGASYKGYTLVEILIVVTILGIVALAAIPNFGSSDDKYLDVASEEVVSLIRFARSEAIRTGEYHGVLVDIDTDLISAVKVEVIAGSIVSTTNLVHPVDKKDYIFNLSNVPFASRVTITNAAQPFIFLGFGAPSPIVLFDAQGMPMVAFGGQQYPLTSGTISLGSGVHGGDVSLSRLGRVTIQ